MHQLHHLLRRHPQLALRRGERGDGVAVNWFRTQMGCVHVPGPGPEPGPIENPYDGEGAETTVYFYQTPRSCFDAGFTRWMEVEDNVVRRGGKCRL
jgi:hypothetical protein